MVQQTSTLESKKAFALSKDYLEQARARLAKAEKAELGDATTIDATIADAVSILEGVIASDAEKTDPDKAFDVMDLLKRAMTLLQTAGSTNPNVREASESIAKTLAIMYPVTKLAEGPSRIPEAPYPGIKQPPPLAAERRRAPRIAIEADIGFQSDTNFFMGFTEDISTGGLFIATYDVREKGSLLSVNFTLPDGHLISAQGIVRWVREYNETTPDIVPGMGVQFEDLDPNDKEMIYHFIEKRPPIFYDE
ncbi:MAG: TIGR02266 family protein [Myxococcota bacterium]|nr:TIGR02266 family protein [Myxococcota bacterium]